MKTTPLILAIICTAILTVVSMPGICEKPPTVVVYPFDSINIDIETSDAIGMSISAALTAKHIDVLDPHSVRAITEQQTTQDHQLQESGASTQTANTVQETDSSNSTKIDCDAYLKGRVIGLGSQIQIQITIHRADSTKIQTLNQVARNQRDLPRVTALLVQEIGAIVQPASAEGSTKSSQNSAKNSKPITANFGVLIGQTFAIASSMRSYLLLEFDARLEYNRIMFIINAGGNLTNDTKGNETGFFAMSLAGAGYLSSGGISPYVGAGFGPFIGEKIEKKSSSASDYDGYKYAIVGWEFFPMLGVEFLRLSKMRLHAEVRYSLNVASGDGTTGFGHGPSVLMGVNF